MDAGEPTAPRPGVPQESVKPGAGAGARDGYNAAMPVTVDLSPEWEARLLREAARLGLPPEALAARAIEQQLRDAERNGGGASEERDEAPHVYKHPRVSGGDACVGNTRVPVWTLVRFRQLGRTDEQLLADFPSLKPADLAAAWSYAARHPEEIERAILEQERA